MPFSALLDSQSRSPFRKNLNLGRCAASPPAEGPLAIELVSSKRSCCSMSSSKVSSRPRVLTGVSSKVSPPGPAAMAGLGGSVTTPASTSPSSTIRLNEALPFSPLSRRAGDRDRVFFFWLAAKAPRGEPRPPLAPPPPKRSGSTPRRWTLSPPASARSRSRARCSVQTRCSWKEE